MQKLLSKSKVLDYTINPYIVCEYGCTYCYADMRKEFLMNLIRGARLIAGRRSTFAVKVKEEEIPRGISER